MDYIAHLKAFTIKFPKGTVSDFAHYLNALKSIREL